MPQRFLRPGLRDSRRWNRCSWPAQSLYVRLLTVVDDYGRYESDPDLICGHCFARRRDVLPTNVCNWLQELANAGLLFCYSADEHEYFQLTGWKEKPRSDSKYPDPPDTTTVTQINSNSPEQMLTNVNKCYPPSSSSSSSSSPPPSPDVRGCNQPPGPVLPETEPPKGFPASEDEAKDQAQFAGVTPDTAVKAYHKAVSRGYTDAKGNSIRNFRSYLKIEQTYADERNNKPNPRNAGLATDPTEQGKRIAEVIARRQRESENRNHTA